LDDTDRPDEPAAGPSAAEMRSFAYLLLGRREYSAWELNNRLRKKWPHEDSTAALVDQLCDEDLVSDQRYAESFLRSRVQRHQGPLKIRAALRGKHVSDRIIATALDTMSEQWRELAADWLRRQRITKLAYDDRPRYYRRLMNRGFTHEQAMSAIDSF
jgi:regulatory protein